MKFERKIIPTRDIFPNDGQISGLPKNPRQIKDEKFEKLVQSIEEHPGFLELREILTIPYADAYVALAGNMRLRACIAAGKTKVPCKIIPSDTPIETLKAIVIKDNIGYGENDWDLLANEWDHQQLVDWGMDVPASLDNDDDDEPEEKSYIPTFKFEVECTTESDRNKLMAELLGRGFSCTDDY